MTDTPQSPAPPQSPLPLRPAPSHLDGSTTPAWPIEALVGPGREALILHDSQTYRLRITAQNRLILTK